jgi:hypothetical protein
LRKIAKLFDNKDMIGSEVVAYRPTTTQQEILFPMEGLPAPAIPTRNYRERGQLLIPGVRTPVQELKIGFHKLESVPTGHWPNFIFEYKTQAGKIYPIHFTISLADNTVRGLLLFIQYVLALNKSLQYTLKIGRKSYVLPLPSLPKDIEAQFIYNAQICLKLQFIEEYFESRIKPFTLPPTISADQVAAVEHVFRALTEGEFSTYTNVLALMKMKPGGLDLVEPPFTVPGPLHLPSESDKNWNKNWKIPLLGQLIELGPLSYHLKMATPYDPDQIERLRREWSKPENIAIVCLDQEVTDRYEKYYEIHNQLRHNLNEFKAKLAQNEPSEFATLVERSLVKGIPSKEAESIARNWLIYNPLPNYYLPFAVTDDEDPDNWHVKVGMLNKEKTNVIGEIVGEIVINKKTGKVISYPAFEYLWERVLNEIPIQELPNDEILRLSKFRLSPNVEEDLDYLLEKNNEGELDPEEQRKLNDLVEVYEKSNVLKSEGLKLAVERGLREPLHP